MSGRLHNVINHLLVPAVVAGLWTLAALRNTKPTTYFGTWLEADGWHTGDPYAAPGFMIVSDEPDDDNAPVQQRRPALPTLADSSEMFDELP